MPGNQEGPWGSGSQGPWGQGNPPDLEKSLQQLQDKIRRMLPKGGWGSGGVILLVIVAVAGLWLASGLYRVLPDEQGVVLLFGQFVRTEQPGLRYHLPFPFEEVFKPKVTRVNRIEIGYVTTGTGNFSAERDVSDESLMLTGDENIVDIDFTVFWVIRDAGKYLFKIRNPQGTVKIAAESAMREVIGQTDLQPALTEAREQIEQSTSALLQQILDEYESGIQITQVQLQKSDPPAQVVDAFNEVQRARSDRERLRNEAEAYVNDIIPRARGEAEQLIQEASAYQEQVVSLAQGDADRFLSVHRAYQISPEVVATRLFLETMELVLRSSDKIIIESAAGSPQGVVPYLPLGELRRAPAAKSQSAGSR